MNFNNKNEIVKNVQKHLGLTVDGVAGIKTWSAIENNLTNKTNEKGGIKDKIRNVQGFLRLNSDGIDGQVTWNGITKALNINEVEPSTDMSNKWPKQNYSELVRFYGEVGTNQTTLDLPYEMKLAWDLGKKIKRITCHVKVKDSLERIFKKTLEHYGLEKIQELRLDVFGGCLNVRKMRGGSSYSMHSWGIAVDLDPDRNQLKWGRDRAVFAKPDYEAFWKIVEDEGGVSLGRERNMDWMHFQFSRL